MNHIDNQHEPPLRHGFTLIDMTVTILIIGIMAAVAAPRFAETLHIYRADSAAKRVLADLTMARQNAVASSTTRSVQFAPATNDYSMPNIPNPDHSGQAYSVNLATYPYQATLVKGTLGGDSDIQFDRFGKPDSGGTITVQSGSFQQTVTVDAETGKVTIP